MTDSRTGAGNTQNEHRASCIVRRYEVPGERKSMKRKRKLPMMGDVKGTQI